MLQAVAAHHMDIDWPSLEAMIVQAADAISAARPGARRDILESYVKRLEKLEGIADSFQGVSKAFALQAGREIRIMVESDHVSDEETVWLSKDIARRIENELEYPGQIKVTVIRETRAVDYARNGERTRRRDGRRRRRARRSSSASDGGFRRRRARSSSASATMPPWRAGDAARLQVLTTDALVEGVHFDRRFSTRRATSATRRSPSTSATSRPWARRRGCALLSLILPAGACRSPTSTRCSTACSRLAAATGVTLAGGNITRSPGPLIVDVTVIGSVRPRRSPDAQRRAARRCALS